MSRNLRLATFIAIPIAVLLLPLVAFGLDRTLNAGEVLRNVQVGPVAVGGLDEADAAAAVRAHEASLLAQEPVFSVDGVEFVLDPAEVGLEIDEDTLAAQAMLERRDGGFFAQFGSWWRGFREPIELELPVRVDLEALEAVFGEWEQQAIANPAYEGAVVVKNGRALPDYPRSGEAIERGEATRIVIATLSHTSATSTVLPLRTANPELTEADIDAAVERANLIIDGPVTLTSENPEVEVAFSADDLAAALRSQVARNSPAQLVLSLDAEMLGPVLRRHRNQIEQPPADAEFVVDLETNRVSIVPSRPATLLDVGLVVERLLEVAESGRDSGDFPFDFGAPPSFTTEDAEAYGPLGLVSKFTTEHPSGQPRVTNIHLIAEEVDGAIVWPGDTFSLNEHVGERTAEEGYVPAPMILRGELVDDVGGGVSQFATTFYNAVFYGCYEDVDHKPHSYYFSRYPEVNEATISWPQPDVVFRNDSDAPIIIRTQYTATSITVRFYGNNGGRTCDRVLGERHAFRSPPVEYVPDAALTPDEERIIQSGFDGWTNTVTRIMTHAEGSTTEQTWSWNYLPQPRIIKVHPCNVPGADEACPVLVPSVVGAALADARASLEGAGFVFARGEDVPVESETAGGTVVAQSPEGGVYLPAGTTITVRAGVYTPPEEPPPDDGS